MPTCIIAEAGVNHNGSLDIAKRLVEAAALAGADYVKFQTYSTEALVLRSAPKADYQRRQTEGGDDQYAMLKQLELTPAMHEALIAHCQLVGIRFLSTGFDTTSIDYLDQLGVPFFKIPSGEITNKPYLRHVASKGKPVVLSTGMATLEEVKQAIQVMKECGLNQKQLTVLHCTTEYPAPLNEVNLRAMLNLRDELDIQVGYSDHTQGIAVPIAAVTLGAVVIEKHFTLDRTMPGPDHAASLEPEAFKAMVDAIRDVELALTGTGLKQPGSGELINRAAARKSIVAATAIKQGELFTELNLTAKRPGTGQSPMNWDLYIGQPSARNYELDDLIEPQEPCKK